MNQVHSHAQHVGALRHESQSRRRFLRSAGISLALPAFGSLMPKRLLAKGPRSDGTLAISPTGAPLRMAFVYVPNGVHQGHWWPKAKGTEFDLSPTLEPLASVKDQIQVLGGLDHANANGGTEGSGDHARASGTFLTGVRVKKTAGADVHAGTSVDQVAVQRIGHLTRVPSLELTCDAVRKSGNCDSGYSCAYQFNLAWSSPTMALPPEPNPRLVFERLFGAGSRGERKKNLELRREQQQSILDFVRDDAVALERQLGGRDRQKLDQYLTSVREIEHQIERSEQFKDVPNPAINSPAGVPTGFQEHIGLMYDMMILAFQTDSTRIATFLIAGEGSNRNFPEIGIAEGHHNLSHHLNQPEPMDKVARIDQWYMRQFARFLEKLEETKDVDGTSVLSNSMIVYGSGNSDGNHHTHLNLPVILAGRGGGAMPTGRYLRFKSRPMSNLYLSMLDRLGVQGVARIGDSTGRLERI